MPSRPLTYRLEGHTPVPEPDIRTWAKRFDMRSADRIVAQTQVGSKFVSTVFVGIDYDFSENGVPLTFETMVFDLRNSETRRYSTWAEAEAGHAEIVARLQEETR